MPAPWTALPACNLPAACLPARAINRRASIPLLQQVFAITGATAVCAVVYILPVAIHLKLYFRGSLGSLGSGLYRAKHHASGSGGRSLPSMRRRHSFSFDHRLATLPAVAAARSSGGEGPDARWLLANDHLSEMGPSRRTAAGYGPAAQQQQQQQQWAQEPAAAEEGEEEVAPAAAATMRGHRWTDISLNRWLAGQSYDSLGCSDSLPQTPMSPGRQGRDSFDSPRAEPYGSVGASWLDSGNDAQCGSSGSPEEQPPPPPQQQQPWGSAEAAAALPAVPEAVPVTALSPVPEGPDSVAVLQSRLSGRGGSCSVASYPCFSEAGSGWAAVGPLCWHVVVPLMVLLAGAASSLSALFLAVAAASQMLRAA